MSDLLVDSLHSRQRSARWFPSIGAWQSADGWNFRVWAPAASRITLVTPEGGRRELSRNADGTFSGCWSDFSTGDRYSYLVDERGPFPDPASRFQPQGVHGPSQLVDPTMFKWHDARWPGLRIEDAIIYELHIGTFTREGTFRGAAVKLPALAKLGVTAIELMPVADFAGDRNWGYDGVALFAPARCYGTPDDLRHVVDEAHRHGLAVIQDVVYNHFGPAGAYHGQFSPMWFSNDKSPWGSAINVHPGEGEPVRAFFIENALHWLHEYHMDGLRLDAIHALIGDGDQPLVRELVTRVRERGPSRAVIVTAEDDRNDATLVRDLAGGGWGLDAVWADDFHHQVRRLLAGDSDGYYADYLGTSADIADTINNGWFYRGQHSGYQGKPRGTATDDLPRHQFVICVQNHDQVGNRALGDRLHHSVDRSSWRAASALLLLCPETPLLFMGQEWAAGSPFQYFTDHEGSLGEAVTRGRRQEFARFAAFADAGGEAIPDPQARSTFLASSLDWGEREREPHDSVWRLHRALIALRRRLWAANGRDGVLARRIDDDTVMLERREAQGVSWLAVFRLRGSGSVTLRSAAADVRRTGTSWTVELTTEDAPFAADAAPIQVQNRGDALVLRFHRPGAIVLTLGAL